MKYITALLLVSFCMLLALNNCNKKKNTEPEKIATTEADSLPAEIPGKWLLVKHIANINDAQKEYVSPDFIFTYTFNKDGTYSSTTKEETGTLEHAGKWKLVPTKDSIYFYDNTDVPDDPMIGIGNHAEKIVKLTKTELVLMEHLFTEDKPGTSYFKRQ